MSRTKNKNRSEVEHLKGVIKALQSQLRRARQENRSLSKKSHFYENVIEDTAEEIQMVNVCPDCTKGTLIDLDLPKMNITSCDLCDYRKVTKK